MSSRASYVLWSDEIRQRVSKIVATAPKDTRIEIKAPRRTLDQNAKLHAMIGDIAKQHEHAGRKLTTREWKLLFLHALKGELKMLPSIAGDTFVPIGHSTADLSIAECAELIEFLYAKGAEWNIKWSEPELWHRGEPEAAGTERGRHPLDAADALSREKLPDGVRRISADEAIELLPEGDTVHNQSADGSISFGADWSKESAIKVIRTARDIFLATSGFVFLIQHPIGVIEANGRKSIFEADMNKVREFQLRAAGAPHAAPEAQAVAVTPPKPGPAASFLPAGPGKRGSAR